MPIDINMAKTAFAADDAPNFKASRRTSVMDGNALLIIVLQNRQSCCILHRTGLTIRGPLTSIKRGAGAPTAPSL